MERARVTELLFRAVDNELDSDEASLVREQIENCSDCAREAVYVQSLLRIVRERCGRLRAPMHLRIRILSSFDHRKGH